MAAEYLEGGHAAWVAAGLSAYDPRKIGGRDREAPFIATAFSANSRR